MEVVAVVAGFVATAILSFVLTARRFIEALSLAVSVFALAVSLDVAYKVGTSGQEYTPLSFIHIDAIGAVVMLVVSIVALCVAIYAVPYFRKETEKEIIGLTRVRQYFALSNLFMATTFVTMAVNSPVAAWIFLEATTLSTVFLISFYGRQSTVEAAWKYMIVNAVGLLLAFFGTLLYFTVAHEVSLSGLISWDQLAAHARELDPAVVQIAFIFVLIGYGTKVGLAPMHTWKPDTYGKAPAPLGALLSGALLPVAFLILLRFKDITDAAIGSAFSQNLLIGFGILSVVVGALSIYSTEKNKRLLAYSSIEHTGIIALGLGFGGVGLLATFLHMIYHSFVKSALFFLTGNMLLKYHSTKIADVRGALKVKPVNSVLYFIAMFALAGFPPFGLFLTEFFILAAGVQSHLVIVAIALLAMIVAFIGFFRHANAMMFGDPPEHVEKMKHNSWLLVPSAALLTLTLVITFYTPPFVETLINEAVAML